MNISQGFKLAIKSLLARKVRSLLTMLGIIIGVAAVIAIMTIGQGTLAKVEAQFDKMGANMITISIYNRDSTRQINVKDMYELVSNKPELLCDLSPSLTLSGGIKYGNSRHGQTAILGVSEAYPQTQLLNLAEGEFLQYMDVERRANVCVVGSYVSNEIMGGQALGGSIKIRGRNYTVVGVLKTYDELSELEQEGGADDVVYIPYTNVLKLGETPFVGSYTLNSRTRECSEAAVAAIEDKAVRTRVTDALLQAVRGGDTLGAIARAAGRNAQRAADSASQTSYDKICADQQAAYDARNPHKKQEA